MPVPDVTTMSDGEDEEVVDLEAVTRVARVMSWFIPRSSMSLQRPDPFPMLRIDLRPHWVVGLLLILSHGLLYASIILLYLVLSILLDYTSTSDLHP